jgi:glucose/arabinose dehydrogenase
MRVSKLTAGLILSTVAVLGAFSARAQGTAVRENTSPLDPTDLVTPHSVKGATAPQSFGTVLISIGKPKPGSTVSPPFRVGGWAIDRAAVAGTGIDAVRVWALPLAGGDPVILGAATLGINRAGVGAQFGDQFAPSGYRLEVTKSLAPGSYQLWVFARSTVTGTFGEPATVAIEVAPIQSDPRMSVGKPKDGTIISPAFKVKGWAVDLAASSGTGVDAVRVWAIPNVGEAMFLGKATLGLERTGVGAKFGARFTPSGFELDVDPPLPIGNYTLHVLARSTVTGTFNNVRTISIQIGVDVTLEPIATGLDRVVGITHAGDGSGRLFITLQAGKVLIYDGVKIIPTPFLDISPLLSCCGERGLLSIAFHPNHASNRLLFVNYTDDTGATVVARYRVAADDPNAVKPGSARTILTIPQPFTNHNGGQLQFGPDGFLYIGMGDGGGGGDPGNRAQDLGDLLGKMLRIDVDQGLPYVVPPTNPFVGMEGAKPEIWARGLRNPWRFSFDRASGDLFIGDVGQGSVEEIDFQPAASPGGENYGWRLMEGSSCFDPPADCNDGTLTLPIIEYNHSGNKCSVTGGHRYRGSDLSLLDGTYFYADFCTGQIWGAIQGSDGEWVSTEILDTPYRISAFGEDESGELYIADYSNPDGTVFRLVPKP